MGGRPADEDEQGAPAYGDRYPAALAFAAELHRTQVRKGSGIPYITHLLGVSELVWTHGGTEDQAIAALLHDSVEDQHRDGLADEIGERFGPEVLRIVLACTDAVAAEHEAKPPWVERKKGYIERVEGEDAAVALVSCADKVHNARSIVADAAAHGPVVFERFKGRQEGTVWYYRALADAFRRPLGDHPLRVQLCEHVALMGEAAGIDPRAARPVARDGA